VRTFDRNCVGKEKQVDVAITHQMTEDAYSGIIRKDEDEITLVAGDRDYVPMIQDFTENGFVVHVVFWNHAAAKLKKVATKFVSLNPFLGFLTKQWNPK
jgi:uncharacterized LabA/DUF88 family protein